MSCNTLLMLTVIPPNQGMETRRESSGAIYSLVMKERRDENTTYTDLSSVLRLNNPSQAENKQQNDSLGAIDPVIDHLMGSKAFKFVIWGSMGGVLALGLAVMVVLTFFARHDKLEILRGIILTAGIPAFVGYVPVITAAAMLCSRRLR
jgi:hypothetical protein